MTDVSNQSGGVDVNGQSVSVGADIVGRDKIVQVMPSAAPAETIHNSLPNQPYFFGRAAKIWQRRRRC